MQKRNYTILSGITIALLCAITLMSTIIYVNNRNVAKHKLQVAQDRHKHDPVIRYESQIGASILHQVILEGQACDRLHLSKEERTRRMMAVKDAGMQEWDRVRATHYHTQFQPPATD